MNKRLFVLILFVCLIGIFCACSSNIGTSEAEADDVSDETVFTPPEEDGTLAGSWSATFDVLTENSYFYGDGKYVSLIQDPEEETWCVLAYWTENDKSIELKDQKYYAYNSAQETWQEQDKAVPGLVSGTQTNDDSFDGQVTLPDGVQKTVTFNRGEMQMAVPSEVDINLIINGFTVH